VIATGAGASVGSAPAPAARTDAPAPAEKGYGMAGDGSATAAPAEAQVADAGPLQRRGADGRFFSPLVRSIASKEGVSQQELESIPGTGTEGRVTKKDILGYIEQRKATPQPAPQQPAPQQRQAPAQQPAPAAKPQAPAPE